jgi:hypothetical protein
MLAQVLDTIPFTIDENFLSQALCIKAGSRYASRLAELVASARDIAKPKATYRETAVGESGTDSVIVDGIKLTGRVLKVNLEQSATVIPFAATCGREIDAWARTLDNKLEQFWADTIMFLALGAAVSAIEARLKTLLPFDTLSSMNPGSLPDWPLEQQRHVFELLDSTVQTIGITLTDSLLMIPLKSISGIYFTSAEHFSNCQLCPRENCPGRRAPFDKDLYDRRYR